MASIFTFDPNPPRVSSPWSTPQSTTPKLDIAEVGARSLSEHGKIEAFAPQILTLDDVGITKLESEPQEGPVEYKLHLLLRPRTSTAAPQGVSSLLNHEDPRVFARSASPLLDIAAPQMKSSPTPSTQTRQNRLLHLTTQLLWRLQQSSPFHSTSSASLVLPILPEATPKLGVPTRPSQLLPGLEESQGALYEIGVADDGTFVGLTEDEMEESLNNLRAMSASLGCYVEVLRKIEVGSIIHPPAPEPGSPCESLEKIWVTEALVRPDLGGGRDSFSSSPRSGTVIQKPTGIQGEVRQSEIEQIRVSFVGASTSGKSTLLGVLTSSNLDNGRGKTRLSLLKHRHEISSGVTSSVAQELVGYTCPDSHGNARDELPPDVVNYGLSNVESWNDIHTVTADGRLAFLSDSPGLSRYSKSMLRTVISWQPHWVLYCVSAYTDHSTGSKMLDPASPVNLRTLSLSYLSLCLKLNLPVIVAVTKMDLATKATLRSVLSSVLSLLKASGRKPVILPSSPPSSSASLDVAAFSQNISQEDKREVASIVRGIGDSADSSLVPIVLTSSVSGVGIGKLHWLIRSLPVRRSSFPDSSEPAPRPVFHVDETFSMPASRVYSPGADAAAKPEDYGIVLCGHASRGVIDIGDELLLGPFGTADEAQTPPFSCTSTGSDVAELHVWARVAVVSIRNLRLPVRRLLQGQVGTLGVAIVDPNNGLQPVPGPRRYDLSKARRGMILARPCRGVSPHVRASFSAIFFRKDFEDPASPLLLIGGQALIYINSIRAPVKVVAVENLRDPEDTSLAGSLASLSPGDTSPAGAAPEGGLFGYEDEAVAERRSGLRGGAEIEDGRVRIEFVFLRWPECFHQGDRVLVIPSPTTSVGLPSSLPGAGFGSASLERSSSADFPLLSATSLNTLAGFIGFVE